MEVATGWLRYGGPSSEFSFSICGLYDGVPMMGDKFTFWGKPRPEPDPWCTGRFYSRWASPLEDWHVKDLKLTSMPFIIYEDDKVWVRTNLSGYGVACYTLAKNMEDVLYRDE